MKPTDQVDWLLTQRPRILRWVEEQCARQHDFFSRGGNRPPESPPPTNAAATLAYADLTLGFGLAWLGWTNGGVQQLLEEALRHLDLQDEVQSFLFRAYEFRIRQVLESRPRNTSLPAELVRELWSGDGLHGEPNELPHIDELDGRVRVYAINRLRSFSEILEPCGVINSYFVALGCGTKGIWFKELYQLCDIAECSVLVNKVQNLMQVATSLPSSDQALILTVALRLSPRITNALAEDLLSQVTPLLGKLTDLSERTELLGAGFSAAASRTRKECVREFTLYLHELLSSQVGAQVAQTDDRLLEQSIRALTHVGMREELHLLVGRLAELILGDQDVTRFRILLEEKHRRHAREKDSVRDFANPLRGLLSVAGGWFDLALDEPAYRVLDEAWKFLSSVDLDCMTRCRTSWTYARTLGRIPGEEGRKRREALFQFDHCFDTYSTAKYYTIAPLKLVEYLVLGMTVDNRLSMT
jgi:hypothetical protein